MMAHFGWEGKETQSKSLGSGLMAENGVLKGNGKVVIRPKKRDQDFQSRDFSGFPGSRKGLVKPV